MPADYINEGPLTTSEATPQGARPGLGNQPATSRATHVATVAGHRLQHRTPPKGGWGHAALAVADALWSNGIGFDDLPSRITSEWRGGVDDRTGPMGGEIQNVVTTRDSRPACSISLPARRDRPEATG